MSGVKLSLTFIRYFVWLHCNRHFTPSVRCSSLVGSYCFVTMVDTISLNYDSNPVVSSKTISTSGAIKHAYISSSWVRHQLPNIHEQLLNSVPHSDELALLFTGSRASPAQKTSTMTEIVDEDEDGATPPPSHLPSQVASPASHTPTEISNLGSDALLDLPSSSPSLPPSSDVHPNLLQPLTHCHPHPLFKIEQLGVDRRLLVNRKRQLKMYRIWMQGKFRSNPDSRLPIGTVQTVQT
jgi:hypothetical protein